MSWGNEVKDSADADADAAGASAFAVTSAKSVAAGAAAAAKGSEGKKIAKLEEELVENQIRRFWHGN